MLKYIIAIGVTISSFLIVTNTVFALPSLEETADIAEKVYIYAYPLVLMDITKSVTTNTTKPTMIDGRPLAPINQFAIMKTFPNAEFKDVVRPNVDTLYSSAWLDLSKEPVVLSVPNSNGRYYLMPMYDAWTDVFASPGKRTTGTKAGNFIIIGPDWNGKLPANLKKISSPTNMVWIIGRIQTDGKKDYPTVNSLQNKLQLIPLSEWGKPGYKPQSGSVETGIDMKTPPPKQIADMNAVLFFQRFSNILKNNPPHKSDTAIVNEMKKIGIEPGKDFDTTNLSSEEIAAFNLAKKNADEKIQRFMNEQKQSVNGWKIVRSSIGSYGNNYLVRAAVANFGLGANLPQDAIYPSTQIDAQGKLLNGKNQYVLHFKRGKLPPVNAFWSLTLYDENGYFVKNPLDRYVLGSKDKLKFNSDGSLDIYIQHGPPDKTKEANWLPAPEGNFNLLLRLYWPKPSVLEGNWSPPAIKQI